MIKETREIDKKNKIGKQYRALPTLPGHILFLLEAKFSVSAIRIKGNSPLVTKSPINKFSHDLKATKLLRISNNKEF